LGSQPPIPLRAAPRTRGEPVDYDDVALDRLADLLVDRLAVRLGGLMPEQPEQLVDATEIARLHGKTRWWVYEHAGELGAVRLGCGPRPRLGFSPARVAVALRKVSDPEPLAPPPRAKPRRERRRRTNRTASGAELLGVRGQDGH
jgi:hypothetical protein